MQIIESSAHILKQIDVNEHIAKCARICYNSKTNENCKNFVNAKIEQGHLSILRHGSIYAIVANTYSNYNIIKDYANCPYIDFIADKYNYYIATNMQFYYENRNNPIGEVISKYRVSGDYFYNTAIGFKLMRYTIVCETQISTSREFNRTSPNAICEQSTRYVEENGTIIRPWWMTKEIADKINKNDYKGINIENKIYIDTCINSFKNYNYLIYNCDMRKEDARGILPLDTYTKVVYTYSINEWKHIFDLRYFAKTGRPHPNAKILAKLIKDELEQLGYEFK